MSSGTPVVLCLCSHISVISRLISESLSCSACELCSFCAGALGAGAFSTEVPLVRWRLCSLSPTDLGDIWRSKLCCQGFIRVRNVSPMTVEYFGCFVVCWRQIGCSICAIFLSVTECRSGGRELSLLYSLVKLIVITSYAFCVLRIENKAILIVHDYWVPRSFGWYSLLFFWFTYFIVQDIRQRSSCWILLVVRCLMLLPAFACSVANLSRLSADLTEFVFGSYATD